MLKAAQPNGTNPVLLIRAIIIIVPALFQKSFGVHLIFHEDAECPSYFVALFALINVLSDVHFQHLL